MSKVFLIAALINTTNAFTPTFLNTKFSNSKIYMGQKEFNGGEATRDTNPRIYNLDDPKEKQTGQHSIENKVKSGVTKNAESYAEYMKERKAKYMRKFERTTEIYDRGKEYDN